MKLKQLFTIATAVVVLASCSESGSINLNNVEYLQGYFANNTIDYKSADVKELIITTQVEFNRYFGSAKTADNTITELDFTTNNYVAIVTKPTNEEQEIIIKKLTTKGDTVNVTYEVENKGIQPFMLNTLKVFPVSKNVTNANFNQ